MREIRDLVARARPAGLSDRPYPSAKFTSPFAVISNVFKNSNTWPLYRDTVPLKGHTLNSKVSPPYHRMGFNCIL